MSISTIFILQKETKMSSDQKKPSSGSQRPQPLVEERGLKPATNPPKMPEVKPPKSEKDS